MTDISPNNPLNAVMPTVNMQWFPGRVKPYNNIQPFTYTDGETYLDVQTALRSWLSDQLVPFINATFEEYVTEFNLALAKLSGYADEFQAYIDSQKVVFDGKIQEYTDLVNKSTTDFIALSTEAMTAVKNDADRAVAARNQAETFSATMVTLQDNAVTALLNMPDSNTVKKLATVFTKDFIGLGKVQNLAPSEMPVSGPQADYIAQASYPAAVAAALRGRQMISYGHSFIVGSGVTSPNKWVEQFAAKLGIIYPTASVEGDLMRGVAGSSAEEAGNRSIASGSSLRFRIGTSSAFVIAEALINTSRRTGKVAAAKAGALNAIRTIALVSTAKSATPANSSRFTYTGAFSDLVRDDIGQSSTMKVIPSGAADYDRWVEFVMPAPVVYVMTLSQPAGADGTQVRITNQSGGGTITTFDNTAQSAADSPTYQNRVSVPIRIEARVGDTIRVAKSGGGSMTFDGIIVPADSPRPILFMKEPYLKDYSLSTSYPLGSDDVFDYFNAVYDTVKNEFPSAVVADPNASGLWDKNTMIQSDGVHPNVSGSTALAQVMYNAVVAQVPANIIATALRGAL